MEGRFLVACLSRNNGSATPGGRGFRAVYVFVSVSCIAESQRRTGSLLLACGSLSQHEPRVFNLLACLAQTLPSNDSLTQEQLVSHQQDERACWSWADWPGDRNG